MTEILSVQIRELPYEIWSREINEMCSALIQLGLPQLIWRTHLIPTVQRYHDAEEDTSVCLILPTVASELLVWMKISFIWVFQQG